MYQNRERRRAQELKIRRITIVCVGIAIVGVLLAGCLLFYFLFFQGFSSQTAQPSDTLGGTIGTGNLSSAGENTASVKKKKEEIYQGDLILVNNSTEFRQTEGQNLGKIIDLRTKSYKAQDNNVMLNQHIIQHLNKMMDAFFAETQKNDCMIASGYRSRELQQSLYQRDLEETGKSTSLFVTKPGFSEHHTGISFDMGLYPINGVHRNYDGSGPYAWLTQNSYRYGFVVRYAQDKVDITKIGNEPWHFRYVGVPHAYVMKQKNLCLEEYIDFLKAYTYDKPHLMVTTDENQKYEIYYVAAGREDEVTVPVPENNSYEISGNNVDGFVVTVSLS